MTLTLDRPGSCAKCGALSLETRVREWRREALRVSRLSPSEEEARRLDGLGLYLRRQALKVSENARLLDLLDDGHDRLVRYCG